VKRHDDDPAVDMLFGLHPVLEAVESGRRPVDRILVAREGGGRNLGRLLRAAREAGIPVTYLPKTVLARKAGARAVHQGVVAVVAPVAYANPDDVSQAAAKGRRLLLVLDGVEDPRNLGAVVRTAAATGVDGILLGVEATVGLTAVVAKAAAGALERIPVARERKLTARLEALRGAGFRVAALDPRGGTRWDAVSFVGPTVLVAGGEGRGLRRGLLEAADVRVALPLFGGVESLNLSVAVGVLLYEIVRQRSNPENSENSQRRLERP